jgi:hypothetical protein
VEAFIQKRLIEVEFSMSMAFPSDRPPRWCSTDIGAKIFRLCLLGLVFRIGADYLSFGDTVACIQGEILLKQHIMRVKSIKFEKTEWSFPDTVSNLIYGSHSRR